MIEQERGSAGGTSESSRETARGLADTAREMGKEAKETVKETGHKVRDEANRAVDEGTSGLATRGEALAEALRAASSHLQEREEDALGQLADRAAEQVEQLGDRLRRNDLDGMLNGLETFARDHSALFLGSTFVGGLAVGRFLRSSSPEGPSGSAAPRPEPRDRRGAAIESSVGSTSGTGAAWREEVR